MPFFLGPFDPLQLQFNILNQLIAKGSFSVEEVKMILRQSLDPKLSEEEKDQILNSLFKRDHAG